ncbi:MAG: SUMF1/EgtB/PvdO family nonheme iron enzyme [Candidatus Odinarchaeota archaeon]
MGQMDSDEVYLLSSHGNDGEVKEFLALAAKYEKKGKMKLAATAYDRAYGLDPENKDIQISRACILNQLAVREHGITFRFIPAGSFLMGSDSGEPDEQPVHPVKLDGYWLSEVPMSWNKYCELSDLGKAPCIRDNEWASFFSFQTSTEAPWTRDSEEDPKKLRAKRLSLVNENKIRFHYCEDGAERSMFGNADDLGNYYMPWGNWHVIKKSPRLSNSPERDGIESRSYSQKPMVSVSLETAEELCRELSNSRVTYRLPTEAEWEKGARGGLINRKYPWGNEPPNAFRCDFNRLEWFSILPSKAFPPNDYGLYAMSGGVWEWTSDWYDAGYYRTSPRENPAGPEAGVERVLRGGSWADVAGAVTVSFRMTRSLERGPSGIWGHHWCPNIGFRICREETSSDSVSL